MSGIRHESAASRFSHLVHAIPGLVQWILFGYLSVLVILLFLHPSSIQVVTYHAPPPLLTAALGAAFVALAAGLTGRSSPVLRNISLAAVLLGIYLTARVFPLGDYTTWRAVAQTDCLHGSSILANLTYRVVFRLFGLAGIGYIAPAFGFLTAFVYFTVCDRLFLDSNRVDRAARRRFIGIYYLGSGFHLLFFFNYFEVSQLACPFLLLFLYHLVVYGRARQGRELLFGVRLRVLAATGCLALACLTHLQNLAFAPALLLAIVIRRGAEERLQAVAAESLASLAVGIVTALAVILGLRWIGLEIVTGHVSTATPVLFSMIWPYKVMEAANIVLLCSPIAFACPLLLLRLRRLPPGPRSSRRCLLQLVAVGGVGFFSLYGYHLGFPGDYDLMIVPSMALNLALLEIVMTDFEAGRWPGRLRWGAAVPGLVMTWAVMSGLLAPDPATGGRMLDVLRGRRAPQLTMVSRAEGHLVVSLERVPDTYDEGWVYLSLRTARPAGQGAFFGIEADLISLQSRIHSPLPGKLFHFPKHDTEAFPNVPFTVPAHIASALRGKTLDGVAVFARRNGQVVAVSNVARVTVR
jgi:hypothetical protein